MNVLAFTVALLTGFSAAAGDGLSDKLKSLWLDLVAINSGTDNLEGQAAVRKKLLPEFEKLGFKAQIFEGGQGHKTVVLRFPEAQPHLALIGHTDTVFSKDSAFQKPTLEGEWLHGPGAQDMKGGLILMLDVLNEI